ncbi:MAG: BON domain-containing protein [Gemmatimonadaceae bacterium]
MRRIRFHDDEPSVGSLVASLSVGALAGFAVGVLVAQKLGGLSGITQRLRSRVERAGEMLAGEEEFDEDELETGEDEDEGYDPDDADAALEESVLAAFRDDAVLAERAIDIGAVGEGIIELSGRVDTEEESEHAIAIARAVENVTTVVNRLTVGDEEELIEENVRRFENGDEAMREAQWEGNRVGTGKRRQGSSAELDRHASPKPELEDKWMGENDAIKNAAEETDGTTGRRASSKGSKQRGGRTDGSPTSPTGVPKADHVQDPTGEDRAD